MKLLITGMMGPGTLEAKIVPLAKLDVVSEIIFVRKSPGSKIPKTKYIQVPLINLFPFLHLIITPLKLLQIVLSHKPNLIVGYHIIPYGFFVAIIGIVSKTPYVIGQTGLTIQELSSKWYFKIFLSYIFKNSLQVNCPGSSSVRFWQYTFPEIKERFTVLHSTIDTEIFKHKSHVTKVYDFIVLSRLAPIKNIDIIISAFSKIVYENSIKIKPSLVIVGSGPEEQKLKNIVQNLKLEEYVSFTGFVKETSEVLNQSRFMVMASSSEGLPTAMMQAMSCEVIPISNIVGNIGDLIEDRVTGLSHDGTVDSIYQSFMISLNLSDKDYSTMKKAARMRIVMQHSHSSSLTKWDVVLKRLCHNLGT